MKYNIVEEKDRIIIKNIKDFHPQHIFECGQAFRWTREEDSSYTTVAYGKVLNVKKEGEDIILSPTNKEDFQNIWYNYFDLDRDYGKIKKELSKDPILKEATKFGHGIRILNQEAFEIIISFIISANNQIPRIKNSIELIAKYYGEKINMEDQILHSIQNDNTVKLEQEYNIHPENNRPCHPERREGSYFIKKSIFQKKYYSFPTPKALSKVSPEELREITRVGFRDKRIVETSRIIANGEIDIKDIFNQSRDEGKETLMTLPGVGPKVSDCILLFAFDKEEAFPVDVWVKRVMEHFYLKEDTNVKKIGFHGARLFGNLAGFAQQYLFYYAREEGIGK